MKYNKPVQESWNQLHKIDTSEWIAQPKLDGHRTNLSVIDGKVIFETDDGNEKAYKFPEITTSALKSLPEGTSLDGELCILKDDYNADLYSLATRNVNNTTKAIKLAEQNPATFVAFDITKYKNESVTDLSWQARNDILQTVVPTNDYIKPIASYNPMDLVTKIQPLNMEGMVIKRKNGSYHSKWFKMKYYQEYDFKIIGTTSKTRTISSLELENLNNGDYAGKVNSNNLVKQTTDFAKSIIGKTATVRCRITESGKVREPVLIRIK